VTCCKYADNLLHLAENKSYQIGGYLQVCYFNCIYLLIIKVWKYFQSVNEVLRTKEFKFLPTILSECEKRLLDGVNNQYKSEYKKLDEVK
jgi:hypothetical protein